MDAQVQVPNGKSIRQSLEGKWKAAHYDLLQLCNELEIELASILRSKSATSSVPAASRAFAKTLEILPTEETSSKALIELLEMRNLLAHGKAEVVEFGSGLAIVLRVAHPSKALNARVILEKEYKLLVASWRKMLEDALKSARSLATQPTPRPAPTT